MLYLDVRPIKLCSSAAYARTSHPLHTLPLGGSLAFVLTPPIWHGVAEEWFRPCADPGVAELVNQEDSYDSDRYVQRGESIHAPARLRCRVTLRKAARRSITWSSSPRSTRRQSTAFRIGKPWWRYPVSSASLAAPGDGDRAPRHVSSSALDVVPWGTRDTEASDHHCVWADSSL